MNAPSLAAVDRRLAELRSTLDRTRANLAELDADVTRKTLDASTTLAGTTATSWAEARSAMTRMWEGQMALDAVLDEATAMRGTRGGLGRGALARLDTVVHGPSVALPAPDSPVGRHTLTEGSRPTVQHTIDEVIESMSHDYGTVVGMVDRVFTVWSTVLPEVEQLSASVDRLAGERGADGTVVTELDLARSVIADCRALAVDDPLGVPVDELASVRRAVEAATVRARTEAAAVLELDEVLGTARADLDAARSVLAELSRRRDDGTQLVVPAPDGGPTPVEVEQEVDELGHELRAIRMLARRRPADARARSDVVGRRAVVVLERARAIVGAEESGVALRDELRGRLDALRVKARAAGRAEDLDLDRIGREAGDALFHAPCDLERATALVDRYRRALQPEGGGGV